MSSSEEQERNESFLENEYLELGMSRCLDAVHRDDLSERVTEACIRNRLAKGVSSTKATQLKPESINGLPE